MKYDHISLDLETFGTTPGSVILTVGAVAFNIDSVMDDVVDAAIFHTAIDLKDSFKHGLTVEASTLLWWLEQSGSARNALAEMQLRANGLDQTLDYFNGWVRLMTDAKQVKVWGYGSTFDNSLLRAAYRAASPGTFPAWEFRNDKCLRTVKGELPVSVCEGIEFVGTPHNVLDDAIHQAKQVQACLKYLRNAASNFHGNK